MGAELVSTLMFYVFSTLLLLSGAAVISSRNPVHSVFFLILAFFNCAGLFLLIGAEYLAMSLVIVYVGAVAVLFLFVVMMLDVNFAEMRQGFMRYLPVGVGVAGVIFAELILVIYRSLMTAQDPVVGHDAMISELTNTRALGTQIYTHYIFAFQLAGLILLVAMVGAIVLTLRHRPGVKRQKIARQVARRREDAVALVNVDPGQGVS